MKVKPHRHTIEQGGTGERTAQEAINALTQVEAATNGYVLTKDTATGDAQWKVSAAPGSATDHGTLLNLGDDTHTQYLLAATYGGRATFSANWTDLTDAGATTLHKHDHGGQDGLTDDDHTQYLLASAATDRATFSANWTLLTGGSATTLHKHAISGEAQAEPSDPAANSWILWLSNGTGAGDAGDIMIKVNSGGTVKTAKLLDFSILS